MTTIEEHTESGQETPGSRDTDEKVVLRARELSVYYCDFRAVRDVSMYVKRGEITAFIGPSGCGK
ncbi:MAG: phosphate ABC transporter ATP-binding protein, partial [Acidimicrobiales bacterium]